jgi:endonuclease YncB( thermonuclease family)
MGSCCTTDIDISHVKYKETAVFIPPITKAYVIKVYDGDTFTIATSFPRDKHIYRFSVRIRGIDCPELRTKNSNEKYVALLAKNFVTAQIFNKYVILRNIAYDKYGRLLADIMINKRNLATMLLKKNMAVSYDGGTKICPKNWKTYYQKVNT